LGNFDVIARQLNLAVSTQGIACWCALGALIAGSAPGTAQETPMTVLFGTYATGAEQGIYAAQFDPVTGTLGQPRRVGNLPNPGFLAIAPNQKYLVAVGRGEARTPHAKGRIAALQINRKTHALELLNELPTEGDGPCHVSLHPSGRFAAVANYGSGSVEMFALDEAGRLIQQTAFVQHEGSSVDPKRQTAPHAHSFNFDASGRFVLAADLGLDQIRVYSFDADGGTLLPTEFPAGRVPPGAGPRHVAQHPAQDLVFVVNEMGGSVTSFRYDAEQGRLDAIETTDALPPGYAEPRRAAEILAHPNGKWVYCSHRGQDSIAALAVDHATGHLKLLGWGPTQGAWPRSFAIDPSGRWIVAANQNGNNVSVLRIDPTTGEVTSTDQVIEVPAAVCVRFLHQPL
jgi:6-phosphogluconolactonase